MRTVYAITKLQTVWTIILSNAKKTQTKTAVNHTVKGPISDLPVRRSSGLLLQDTLHAGASTAKLQTETVLGE